MNATDKTMEKITTLAKGRGFVFAGSEIYGGLSNTWDYGPLGVEFKNNVKKAWMKKFVQESKYNVGLDAAILMNPQVWVASGHVGGFSDPLMDCKECKTRHRADQLIGGCRLQRRPAVTAGEDVRSHQGKRHPLPGLRQMQFYRHPAVQSDVQNLPGRDRGRQERAVTCVRKRRRAFLSTFSMSSVPPAASCPLALLRSANPSATRSRPAISPSAPGNLSRWSWNFSASPAPIWNGLLIGRITATTGCSSLGIDGGEPSSARPRKGGAVPSIPTPPPTLSSCSPSAGASCGALPTGPTSTWAAIMEHSGKTLEYFDQETNEQYIPYVIEPSLGADRVALAFLCDAYDEENVCGERRHPRGAASAPGAGALQGVRSARCPKKLAEPAQTTSAPELSEALYGGLRRRRLHRQAVPPSG